MIIYRTSCTCEVLEMDLWVVYNQVALNLSAVKQNNIIYMEDSKTSERWAISLKHTWKRKLNTYAATVRGFHWAPPECLAKR